MSELCERKKKSSATVTPSLEFGLLSRLMMPNIVACFLFYLVIKICLSEPIVDTDENEKVHEVNSDTKSSLRDIESIARNVNKKITDDVLEETFKDCEKDINQIKDLEVKLSQKGRVIKSSQKKTDPSLQRMRKFDPLTREIESCQLPFDRASYRLYKRFNLSRDEINQELPTVPLRTKSSRANRDTCRQTTANRDCNTKSRYRTADGQCNNLQNPSWGSAMSCQERMLSAYYEGNSGFRRSVNGGPLPAPRTLSLNLHYNFNRPTNYVTHMYMFFGQLLDHDIALTPFSTTVDNEAIDCCPPENETHPQCAPILVSTNDPFYSQYGVTCLNFVRSVICPTCTMGARQQMDQVTAFIDASFVYGNLDDETISLRENGTGRMRIERSSNGEDLLPSSQNPESDQCSFPETNDTCFEAGDPRANQHNVLTSLHTLFLREHNRLVARLRQINPQWSGERLFQEARRILGAVMQVITYKEYLPITLTSDRMNYFHLRVGGEYTKYNASVNPSMMIEFTTAAFRFGHSLINSVVANRPMNGTNDQRLLRNEFFQPFELRRGLVGPLLSGASNSPAQWFDRHLVPDVTNFLYRIRGNQTGLDLAATNINRGRDHGTPPYVEMVRFCSEGRIVVRSFDDLYRQQLMCHENACALRDHYRSVQDVDLWPGILMETPSDNAVVGPTAACIIGVQFYNLKFGDRFYFEHANQAGSFTSRQLQELRKMSLSQIICLNSNATDMSVNAMLFNSRNNPRINCRDVRGPDLNYWKE